MIRQVDNHLMFVKKKNKKLGEETEKDDVYWLLALIDLLRLRMGSSGEQIIAFLSLT